VDQLDSLTKQGVPSLRACDSLAVKGALEFSAKNIFKGTVRVTNATSVPKPLAAGVYANGDFNI
jgi:hypothetical protein